MWPSSIRGRWWTPKQPVEVTPRRNELIGLWEVEPYGSDSFVDVDVDYVCVYGLRPREWYGHGVRLLGRTVVECTRDRLATRISGDVAAVAAGAATGGTLVVDTFVGSGNKLFWLARRLEPRVAVGFELDDEVAAVTQRNVALLDLPIVVRHAADRAFPSGYIARRLSRPRVVGRRWLRRGS